MDVECPKGGTNPERLARHRACNARYRANHKEEDAIRKAAYYQANREKRRAYAKVYNASHKVEAEARKEGLKRDAFNAYGGPICAACRDTNIRHLQLHHINHDGAAHRKLTGMHCGKVFYTWLKNNGYPPGLAVLCANCHLDMAYAAAWREA